MESEGSSVTPVALLVLLVMMCLTWSLPRRLAICPLLIITCLMPMGQELAIVGLHFHLFRILLLVGMARVVVRREMAELKWTGIDKLFAWWAVVSVVFGTLSKPSIELFINRCGDAYNAIGCYFFIRCVIRDFEDMVTSVRTLAMLCFPVAALMMVERQTMHNPFAVFGGVPVMSALREGHVRCQGAFRHAILAGTFGATQVPMFIGLWVYRPQHRRLAAAGTVAALIIVFAACSSGAILAVLGAFLGLGLWSMRRKMRLIRWGIVAALVVLALVMKAPIWYLLAKVSDLVGGGGWHRAYLIDKAVEHFNEWWLFGTTYTAHWAPSGEVISMDPNMMDITNHFIMEGIKGGMLKLILFIAIITGCFKAVGGWVRADTEYKARAFFVWAMGATLFAHCLSFTSVPYFDQIIVIWYWLLAVIIRLNSLAVEESVDESEMEAEAESVVEPNLAEPEFSSLESDGPQTAY